MSVKSIVSGLLVLFVVASVAYLFIGDSEKTAVVDPSQPDEPVVETAVAHQVVAYYFHGHKRCKTCLRIEELAKETIGAAYLDEIADGRLVWKAVDFEESGNEHFAEEYALVASSLVIVDMHDGVQTDWKILEQVWDLVWEDEQFVKYVKSEVAVYLGEE